MKIIYKISFHNYTCQSKKVTRMKKDFGKIENEYDFFVRNCDEQINNLRDLRDILNGLTDKDNISILDYGGGDGDFLSKLINKSASYNEIIMLEPCSNYKKCAINNLNPHKVSFVKRLKDVPTNLKFDLIIANHVLYYVNDLSKTIFSLTKLLNTDGKLVINLANKNNETAAMTHFFFSKINKPNPFYFFEDVECYCSNRNIKQISKISNSTLKFEISDNNIISIAKFIFGDYYKQFKEHELIEYMKRFKDGGFIKIKLSDTIMVIN